jgi:trehalose/maltose hydrolase-like predicted phosphorylase
MSTTETIAEIAKPTPDPTWVIGAEGYDRLREHSVESRFAISNGLLGIRGARSISRGARWIAPARTYIAGLFDSSDAPHATRDLVPAADWLRLRILSPEGPLLHHPNDMSSHGMTLDMKRGLLVTQGRNLKAPEIGFNASSLRLVSASERSIGLQIIQFQIEYGEIELRIEALCDGLDLGLVADRLDQDSGEWRTRYSGKRLAMATASFLQVDGQELQPVGMGRLGWSWNWKTHPSQIVTFQRFVSVVRSDSLDRDPSRQARDTLDAARQIGWRKVIDAHTAAWAGRWHYSDVALDGDADAQRALRFAIYHLSSAANPADERVSIGARALTGDDYHGHVFWDTEIFLLPFYTLTWPEAARALLMYRFHTLDAARGKAAEMGWLGAMYAWESADTGEEMTPKQVLGPSGQVIDVLCGTQEQHISADVAYAVWQYWQVTRDEGFLLEAGAEILLETGRFWASRAQRGSDGRCHIRGVIGPDEYHEHIDDNAYTNVMARWTIRRALETAALLRQRWPARWTELSARLGLEDSELAHWSDVADTMATGFDPKTGLFEQFDGFFGLEYVDLAQYAGRSVPMDVVLGRERTQQSQVIKQSDVVALMALLPEEFPGDSAAANFGYYQPRCSHGSSLSPAMHGMIAARLGDLDMALRFFRQTAAIDLEATSVSNGGGVHIAALGGLWMLGVLGFAGLSLREDGVAVDPRLPAGWNSLAFRVQWRQRCVAISINQATQTVEATLEAGGDPMVVAVGGVSHALRPEQKLVVPFAAGS